MSWFEETEARARRSRGAAPLARTLLAGLRGAGPSPALAAQVARGLAQIYLLGQDFVLTIDDLFLLVDGEQEALLTWLLQAEGLTEELTWYLRRVEEPLIQYLAALQLDDEPPVWQPAPGGDPQERLAFGSYSEAYRYLFERVELKMTAAGLEAALAATLAGHLTDTYEGLLKAQERIWRLSRATPRFSELAHWLLDLNAFLHFSLLPNHLEGRPPAAGVGRLPGLPTALRLARQALLSQP